MCDRLGLAYFPHFQPPDGNASAHAPCHTLCVLFFSSLTAVPSENQCLKHAVGLSQHWFSNFFTVGMLLRKPQ